MMIPSRRSVTHASAVLVLAATSVLAHAQHKPAPPPPGPMFASDRVTLTSSSLTVKLLSYSGTVAQLSPQSAPAWDYTPGDLLKERSADTFYHLGDLDLRFRVQGASDWTTVSTAFHREQVKVLSSNEKTFSADVSSSFPEGTPLGVVRTWAVENGDVALHFTLTNKGSQPLELGGIGMAMVFNNMINTRTLEQAYGACSFYDPYIGEDAGYVQVSPLKGTGPVLLVVPDGHTPLEAWKPIMDKRDRKTGLGELGNDPEGHWTTFEGSYDWMVNSKAYADTEWHGAQEWNTPTEQMLAPGKSVTVGVRFIVAPGLRQIESTLAAHRRPVAVGVPGYILPEDIDAKLFLRYDKPVKVMTVEPEGAIAIHDDGRLKSGLHAYTLEGKTWGRSRLTITYADGTVQTIGYRTIKPERETLADLGHFLFNEQWFDDKKDPFHRGPSVISYDDEAHKQVTQEPRVWIAGLSDEGGSGAWLASAMKEYLEPNKDEVAKLEAFVNQTVWGHLQVAEGEHKYGVHKSLFFYQPDAMPNFQYDKDINWKSWTSWNKEGAEDVGRTFNYPHVVAAYWSLYRIARNTNGLAAEKPWSWYLDQAYETTIAMQTQAPYYLRFGLMEGTVFLRLLEDLKHEGLQDAQWTVKATKLEAMMRERAGIWKDEAYPFGSEMAWDSTGQEEVYDWTNYFGDKDKAEVTLNAILAYDPTIPSWGYNGSARRYWDFLYGGKYPRVERQLHHYGSGLNAIPLLAEYRTHPDDLYLLRVGYGGVMGPLSNINQEGFASAAFHSFPDRMAFDPYSGDYGPNLLGHALNTGVYVAHNDAMGWLCFGGNLIEHGDTLHVTVLDSSRKRVFLAPAGLWITLDAGQIASVDYDTKRETVRVHLAAATDAVKSARLRYEATVGGHTWTLAGSSGKDGGASVIALGRGETTVELRQQ
ncbi:hypothetical protein ESZ00_05090 [Silvibacterium dinghuense]|uniref:Uncharacterized protein n=2 Tax=Silvibacterium dinghuense TaxID=1560006 RepID=A0A4Q1SIQ4_9BACT|nr:hypothetical protein ESZ00_05090 [Silvibacterium dinghuense]